MMMADTDLSCTTKGGKPIWINLSLFCVSSRTSAQHCTTQHSTTPHGLFAAVQRQYDRLEMENKRTKRTER